MGMTMAFGLVAGFVEYLWGAVAQGLTLGVGLVTVLVVGVNVLLNPEERQVMISMMTRHSRLVKSSS
jgi:hypothetical protein